MKTKELWILIFSIVLLICLSVLAYVFVGDKFPVWILMMGWGIFVTLRWSGFKGWSTVFIWVAIGFFEYAVLWLEPAGQISGGQLYILALITGVLVLWERFVRPNKRSSD
jgi:hypothetical protein